MRSLVNRPTTSPQHGKERADETHGEHWWLVARRYALRTAGALWLVAI